MVYESWATYVNRLFEDYSCGKHTCQERDSDKVGLRHSPITSVPQKMVNLLAWKDETRRRKTGKQLKYCLNGYSCIPSAQNTVQSIRIDLGCCSELFLCFIAAAGSACWKCGCSFSPHWGHPTLTRTFHFPLRLLLPSALKRLPACPPTRFAATRCCSTTPPPHTPTPSPPKQHHGINMHLPDKWSTLSVFSRQILSLPLAVSQPFDLSVCLHISPRLHRMPSVLGKLQARRSGSRDLEGIGKTQLNGRSCLCLTLPT